MRIVSPMLLVFALQLLAPDIGSAQLGGLTKKVKKAAEGQVESAMPFTPLPPPEFNEWVLEITPERVTQVLKGFDAEVAGAKTAKAEYEAWKRGREQEEADYERAAEAYRKDNERYIACRDKWEEAEAKTRSANEAKMQRPIEELDDDQVKARYERLFKQGEKFSERADKGTLDPANDPEFQAWAKEMQVVQAEMQRRSMAVMAGMRAEQERQRTADPRLVAACGPRPKEPVRPEGWSNGPEDFLMRKGAVAADLQGPSQDRDGKGAGVGPSAGLDDLVRRWAIMRERVLYWLASRGRPSQMGFSQVEMDALKAQSKPLEDAVSRLKKAGVPL